MASQKDIDFIYTTLDEIYRKSQGETADFSGAMYNGDFSMTLEEAQLAKHRFIAEQLGIREGSRVLDMGCGWGPILNFCQSIGAKGTGLTLSEGQYQANKKKGFDVHVKDVRTVKPDDFGTFDAVVSLGAFEHFCSADEYKAGKQEEVYRNFFETVANLLPKGRRFFLQTMTITDKMMEPEEMDIRAPKGSDSYVCALVVKLHPGSWLPKGSEMLLRDAAPWFDMVTMSSGRLDYIETITQWSRNFRKFDPAKYALLARLGLEFLIRPEFRHLIPVFLVNPIRECFKRELMEHYRIVFERK